MVDVLKCAIGAKTYFEYLNVCDINYKMTFTKMLLLRKQKESKCDGSEIVLFSFVYVDSYRVSLIRAKA